MSPNEVLLTCLVLLFVAFMSYVIWQARADKKRLDSLNQELKSCIQQEKEGSVAGELISEDAFATVSSIPDHPSFAIPKWVWGVVAGCIISVSAFYFVLVGKQGSLFVGTSSELAAQGDLYKTIGAMREVDATSSMVSDLMKGHVALNSGATIEHVKEHQVWSANPDVGFHTLDIVGSLNARVPEEELGLTSIQVEVGRHRKGRRPEVEVRDMISGNILPRGFNHGHWDYITSGPDDELSDDWAVSKLEIIPGLAGTSGSRFEYRISYEVEGPYSSEPLRRGYIAPCDFGQKMLKSFSLDITWPTRIDTTWLRYSVLASSLFSADSITVFSCWSRERPRDLEVSLEDNQRTLHVEHPGPVTRAYAILYRAP